MSLYRPITALAGKVHASFPAAWMTQRTRLWRYFNAGKMFGMFLWIRFKSAPPYLKHVTSSDPSLLRVAPRPATKLVPTMMVSLLSQSGVGGKPLTGYFAMPCVITGILRTASAYVGGCVPQMGACGANTIPSNCDPSPLDRERFLLVTCQFADMSLNSP